MKKSSLLVLASSLLFASCTSLSFEKTGNILNKSELAGTDTIDEGKIVFEMEKSALGSFLSGKKVDTPANLSNKDFFIHGKRTYSSSTSSILLSGEDAVTDFIQSSHPYEYRWEGKVIENDAAVPLIFDFYVIGDSPKSFQLIKGYCNAPKPEAKGQKVKSFIFGSIPDGGARLSMKHRISGDRNKIPFEVANFTASSGAEYSIHVTRDYEYKISKVTGKYAEQSEEELWKHFHDWTSTREFVFDKNQVFQITDKENKILFAECSVNDYKLFKPAEEKSEDVKECIKSFIGYLWALDEHNQTSERLK
ncbi:hypothetical protein [Treponema zioleckii]|uniref:hypothetical protein n=1 Tax=Treponema zioleckii TaxID=331680 RepID=UPI00168A5062|nr:hypothetical protein [Treponema zioleckii]